MASKTDKLPEGTDAVEPAPGVGEKLRGHASDIHAQATAKFAELRDQASDHAFSYAAQGKDRASETLDGAAKLIGDTAEQLEELLGGVAGGYARNASDAVAGLATTLRTKEIDDLIEDARIFVKKSPALAIGAAAAAGFLLARVIKAGSATLETTAKSLNPIDAPAKDSKPADIKPKANGKAD